MTCDVIRCELMTCDVIGCDVVRCDVGSCDLSRGECSKCGRTLDTLTITESDVKLLKQEFYEKSIVGT